jgi:hypothetical protein
MLDEELLCRGVDAGWIRDVELDGLDARVCLCHLFQMASTAARDDDLVSALMECFGKRSANA